jgi:hypothetical protein
MQDYFNMSGGMGGMMSHGGGRMEINIDIPGGGSGSPFMSNDNQGLNTSSSVGLNVSHDFSKKSSLTMSYFFNGLKKDLEQTTERQYFLPEENFYNERFDIDDLTKNGNHRVSAFYNLEIDSTQRLRVRGNLGYNIMKYNGIQMGEIRNSEDNLENQSNRNNTSDGDGLDGSLDLTYYKLLNTRGRNVAFNFNGGKNRSLTNATLNALNQFYIDADSTLFEEIMQSQLQDNNQFNYRLDFSITEPLGKRYYLSLQLEQSNFSNRFNQEVYDLLPIYELNEHLSDRYNRDYTYQRGGFNLQRNRKKSNMSVGLKMQRSELKGEVASIEEPIQKVFHNFLPSLTYSYEFGQAKNLNFRYETNINPPTLNQLQPIANNADPLNIYIGNPSLKPEYRHNLNLNYLSFSQFSMISLFANIRGTIIENQITNRQFVDDLFRKINQPVNTDIGYELSGGLSFGAPLKFINSRLKISSRNFFRRENVFVNAVENISKNLTTNLSLRINNRNIEKFDISAGIDFRRNAINYSLQPDFNQEFIQQLLVGEISYFPTKKWALRQSINYSVYDNGREAPPVEIPIWNASISHFAFDQRIEFKASVFDILNRNKGIGQQGAVNYLEYQISNTLSRYFMVSINYSLQKFGARNNNIHIERL